MFPFLFPRSPIPNWASTSPCTSGYARGTVALFCDLILMRISSIMRRPCWPQNAWASSPLAAAFRGIGRSNLAFMLSFSLGAATKNFRSSGTTTVSASAPSQFTGAGFPAALTRKRCRGGNSFRWKKAAALLKFSMTQRSLCRSSPAPFCSAFATLQARARNLHLQSDAHSSCVCCLNGIGAHKRLSSRSFRLVPSMAGSRFGSVVITEEDGSGEHGGPQAALVADCGLRDVHGANDFIRNAVDLFLFVPRQIGIEFDVQRRRQHFRRELFGVFAGHFFRFAEGMMLGKVAVHRLIRRKAQANAGGDQPVRFARLIFADYCKRDLTRLQMFQPFTARNQLAVGRENGRDANNVASGNSGVAQGKLEARKALAVFSNSLGEENFLRDERHESCRVAVPPTMEWKIVS